MRITNGIVAAALVALSGASPTHEDPGRESIEPSDPVAAITASVPSLAGIWHNTTERFADGQVNQVHGLLMRLGLDGTIAYDNAGNIDTNPAVSGTYEVVGDVVSNDFDAGICTIGPDFRATIPEDGHLTALFLETGDGNCDIGVGTEWTWMRVSPSSAAWAAYAASGVPTGHARPIADHRVQGVWQREGSGQLIRFGTDGTYAIDDGGFLGVAPDDTGTYIVDEASITLTSAGSATCAAGAVQIWSRAGLSKVALSQGSGPSVDVLHAEASNADCAISPPGAQTWLHLSP